MPFAAGIGQFHLVGHVCAARAGEGAVLHIGNVFQGAGQRHNFEHRSRRIAPLRRAVDEHAVVRILELLRVRRIVFRVGIQQQHLAGFVVDDSHRAVFSLRELLRGKGLQRSVDGQLHIRPAPFFRKELRDAVGQARIEAEQIRRQKGFRAGGHVPLRIADHMGNRPARLVADGVFPLPVRAGCDKHRAVSIGDIAGNHAVFRIPQAGVIGRCEPAPAVGIRRVEQIAAQHGKQRQRCAQHHADIVFHALHASSTSRASRHSASSCSPTATDTPCRIPSISIQESMDEPP